MSKLLTAGLTALCFAGLSPAFAQQGLGESRVTVISESNLKEFTDRRIEVVRAALQLTPAQEKYWPAIEEAMRARATSRHQRLAKLAAMRKSDGQPNPIEILGVRADNLIQRGASLKKLVDAWQPLYQTLDERQKLRLRFLATYVVREMRDSVESGQMQSLDEDEDY
jgi:Arc/MetJ-type ribon-helix-helix transcriptional regulator